MSGHSYWIGTHRVTVEKGLFNPDIALRLSMISAAILAQNFPLQLQILNRAVNMSGRMFKVVAYKVAL